MSDTNQHADQRSLSELIAESKRLAEYSEEIRRRMDELTEQIAKRAAELEKNVRRSENPGATSSANF